jgi:hypothetical protein
MGGIEFTPQMLVDLIISASGAKIPEERARVLWRANDTLWRDVGYLGFGFPRAFNNLVQDMDRDEKWGWVDNLWTKEEVVANYKARGFSDEQIAQVVK